MLRGHEEEGVDRNRYTGLNRWPNGNGVDVNERLYEPGSVRNLEFEIVKVGDGIGFGPKSDPSG
jgi:hypothetical protein